MMGLVEKFGWGFLIFACLLIFTFVQASSEETGKERHFPLPSGLVSDFSGTLSEEELKALNDALDQANRAVGTDGRVIVAQVTDEWYLDEYVRDYADYLQAQGVMSSSGWLLYISVEDRKFSLAVQDDASKAITAVRRRELELILSESLEKEDLAGAILAAVKAIEKIPALTQRKKAPSSSSNTLIFIGLSIILFTLMLRARRNAKALRESWEER